MFKTHRLRGVERVHISDSLILVCTVFTVMVANSVIYQATVVFHFHVFVWRLSSLCYLSLPAERVYVNRRSQDQCHRD